MNRYRLVSLGSNAEKENLIQDRWRRKPHDKSTDWIPVASTLVGGLVAVRFRRFAHMLVAGGAGLLLRAAFLDLMPEAIALAGPARISTANVLLLTLVSLLLFSCIENCLNALSARRGTHGARKAVGRIAGAMLIFHSVRDGMGIGASYVASHPAGYAVAMGLRLMISVMA